MKYFSVHGFHEPFFYEKTACVFRRFFSSRQTWGRRFLDKPLSLVVMPWREHVGGRECSSCTRERSPRFVPIFALFAWVYRVAEVARFVQYTPSVLSASCLEKRFNQYKTLNHPSAPAPASSASRLAPVSVPRSACLPATRPRSAGM